MVVKCEIRFEQNPTGIYFAGQTIAGRIDLTLDQPKKVRGVCLNIKGFALAQWTQRESRGVGKNRRTHSVTYTGREDYLHSTTYLIGSPGGQAIDILPGIHTFNFSCYLPPTVPTSFEGQHGHIRYTVRVGLERPWKFDQTYKVAFTVLKHVDLNYDTPALRIPSQMEIMKTFCCGPCRSGPLMLSAKIPMSGYAPGQSIYVTANINNGSRVDITEVKFALRKIVVYYSQTPRTSSREEMVDVVVGRLPGVANTKSEQYLQHLLIPALPPTNITQCRVIQITYEVVVEAKTSGAHYNPLIRIPITIGTVPLLMQMAPFAMPMPMPVTTASYPGPSSTDVTPIAIPLADNKDSAESRLSEIPPPSYEECVQGAVAIEDDDENHPIDRNSFAPKYPVYNYVGSP